MPLMQSREQNKKPQIITTKLSFTNKTKAPTAFLLTLSSNFKVSKLWNHSGEQTSHSCSHRAFVRPETGHSITTQGHHFFGKSGHFPSVGMKKQWFQSNLRQMLGSGLNYRTTHWLMLGGWRARCQTAAEREKLLLYHPLSLYLSFSPS